MKLKRSIAILLLAGCATAAFGQLRTLPQNAELGEFRHVHGMTVTIDGTERLLAPGAQVRDATNLIIVPAAIPAGAIAKYTVDAQGMVFRVWILTPLEASQPDKR
jgi:hypothetical protein